jgi:hypothetical protein
VKKQEGLGPWRHQVVEMPQVKPHVTEYQQHSGWCEKCECFTQAQLPEGVPRGAFGPRLMALVALLAGQYRLSTRLVQQLLGDVLEVGNSQVEGGSLHLRGRGRPGADKQHGRACEEEGHYA